MRGQRVLPALLVLLVAGMVGVAAVGAAAAAPVQTQEEFGVEVLTVNHDVDGDTMTVDVDEGTLTFTRGLTPGEYSNSEIETTWALEGETANELEPADPAGISQNYTIADADAGTSFDVVLTAEAGDDVETDTLTVIVEDDAVTPPSVEVESVDHGTADSIDVATDDGTLTFVGSIDPGSYDGSEIDTTWSTEGDAASELEQADRGGAAVNYTLSDADAGATFDVVLTAEAGEHTASDSLTVNVAEAGVTPPSVDLDYLDDKDAESIDVEVDDGTLTFVGAIDAGSFDSSELDRSWTIDGDAANELEQADLADSARNYTLSDADAGATFDVVITVEAGDHSDSDRITVNVAESDVTPPSATVEHIDHDDAESIDVEVDDGTLTFVGGFTKGSYERSEVQTGWTIDGDAENVIETVEPSGTVANYTLAEADAGASFDVVFTVEAGGHADSDSVTVNVADDGGQTAPAAPSNVDATAAGTSSVDVSWGAVADADEYNVYVDGELETTVADTEATVDGLAADTSYEFGVSAENEVDESDVTTVLATTEQHSSSAPTGVEATATSDATVEVTWDAVADADSYNVYVDGERETGTEDTSATIDGLEPDTTYQIGVSAENDAGESDRTTVSVMTDPVPPEAPAEVSAWETDNVTHVTWSAVPNADEYHVHVDGEHETTVEDGTSVTIDASAFDDEYDVGVSAENEAGESDLRTATVAEHGVRVEFDDADLEPGETTNLSFSLPEIPETGVNGVTLEINLDGSVAELTGNHALAGDTWNYDTLDMNHSEAARGDDSLAVVSVNNADGAIDPGETHINIGSVEVRALAEGQTDANVSVREYQDVFENPVTASADVSTLTVDTPPSAPENVSATADSETAIDVEWDVVEGADEYNVYLDGDLQTNVSVTSATLEGLDAGTEYTVGVSAVEGDEESEQSTDTATTHESSSESSGGISLGGGSSSGDSGGEGGEGDGDTQEAGFVLSTASTTMPLVFQGQNAEAGVSASTGVDAALGPVELQTFGATAAQDASSFELTVESVAGPEHMQDRVLAAFAIQDGAEMVNDAELNFAIDEDELPEGVTAEDLYVYGEQDGRWQEASVDPTSSVATAQLSQYDSLAVVGPDEPETEVEGDDGGIGTLGILVVLLLLGAAAGAAFYLRP